MPGEMDPAFFLTARQELHPARISLPHRASPPSTAAGGPDVRGTSRRIRDWLPFGAPALDLSGFWFRPTRLAAWAETRLLGRRRPAPPASGSPPAAARCSS